MERKFNKGDRIICMTQNVTKLSFGSLIEIVFIQSSDFESK